jgi:hypothetical protein
MGKGMKRVKVDPNITLIKETPPTDLTKFNASTLFSFNVAGECVYIDETFNGITYRTTFYRNDMDIYSQLQIGAVEVI